MPKVVFLLGGPGSGKGTECQCLSEEMGERVAIVSLGDLLRQVVERDSERGRAMRAIMEAGALLPSEWVMETLVESMEENQTKEIIVIDGFPRNLENWAAWLAQP